MSYIANLDLGATLIRAAMVALMEMTVVIALAALLAKAALRHRAAARHSLRLVALGWVLISPVAAGLADRSGFAVWTLAIPTPGQETTRVGSKIEADVTVPDQIVEGSAALGRIPGPWRQKPEMSISRSRLRLLMMRKQWVPSASKHKVRRLKSVGEARPIDKDACSSKESRWYG